MIESPGSDAPKADWRDWANAVRADLDMTAISDVVVAGLTSWLPLTEASSVLIYLPIADEIDLVPLTQSLETITFSTTRTPERGGTLTVHELGGPLEVHRFGFLQPHASAPTVAPTELSVLLLPGLAFDLWGVRLGRGAGYYDELLTRVAPGAVIVGVTPIACVVDELPRESHDKLVSHLATEEGIIAVAS